MKAVVMAGGKGTRLRPLTCDTPKPLVPLCGKPVLEYIFDLLIRNGVQEACVTLGYLGHKIEERYADGKYKSLQVTFSREDTPLGTAGSVRAAAKDWQEPFFVVSGDAVCDFELEKVMLYHKAAHSKITIVGCCVEDPREYGLIEKDDAGNVLRFIEKPAWGQATTDLANTGIYIVEPECLQQIPENTPYDFAKDLFPKLLRQKGSLNCYHAEGYWCDIGDVYAYLQCQQDLLQGKIRFPLKKAADGIFVQDTLPAGSYSLVPPVYIGSQVDIADGAEIGPGAVVDAQCIVGAGARVRKSVMLPRSVVYAGACVQESVLCSGAVLQEKACMYEQTVLGADSIVGACASICPHVRIWPEKQIDANSTVRENVRYQNISKNYFGDGGISDSVELTAQTCVALGAAIGSIPQCKKAGVGFDGSNYAGMMLSALQAGMLSAGSHVWSFGECFEAQLSYCTAFCGLSVGVFCVGGEHPQIRICGENGLSVPRFLEREMEDRMRKGEYNRCSAEHCRDIADMRSIRLMYGRELMRQAPFGLRGMEAAVQCANGQISMLMEDTLLKLGCLQKNDLLFRISPDGTRTEAVTVSGTYSHEKLLAVCCLYAFRSGMDVALPYDAPMALDALAQQHGRTVHRYLSDPADTADAAARHLSAKQIFLRDGLYMTVRVLSIMHERGLSVENLCAELPEFFVERKTFSVSFSPAKLHTLFGKQDDTSAVREGVSLEKNGGRLLITPMRSGHALRVTAEANSMEAAAEMCSGFERILAEIEKKQK